MITIIRKSINLFFLLFILFILKGNAQNTFLRTFGGIGNDNGRTGIKTADNGFLIVGTFDNSSVMFSNDLFLIKLDSLCDTTWTKQIGAIGFDVVHYAIQTNDGSYVFAGEINMGAGMGDLYLVKTDSFGNPLWAKAYGGPNLDYAVSVQQTIDGGYILSGSSSISFGNRDVYLLKTDDTGNVQWSRSYGQSGTDVGTFVREIPNIGYIIFGSTRIITGESDILVIQTDLNGDTLWTKTYGRVGISDGISEVCITGNNDYILAGTTMGNGFQTDSYTLKLNSNGDTLWSKVYSTPVYDHFYSVKETSDGGFIFAGRIYDTSLITDEVFIMKSDSLATPTWIKSFDEGWDDAEEVFTTNDGGYLLTGTMRDTTAGPNEYNLLLIKTDSLGISGCQTSVVNFTPLPHATIIGNVNLTLSSGHIMTNIPISSRYGCVVNTICSTTGISDITNTIPFAIYPNPSNGVFTIRFNSESRQRIIEIFDSHGASIYKNILANEYENDFNFEFSSHGVYFISVSDGNNRYYKKMIILPD